MSYNPKINMLGGVRKYSRFEFYDYNDNLERVFNLKTKCEQINKNWDGEEIVLENGELALMEGGHRVQFMLTVFNLEQQDALNILIVQAWCQKVLKGEAKLRIYPEYDPDYHIGSQNKFWVYPVGTHAKRWTSEYVNSSQEFDFNFKSVDYENLYDNYVRKEYYSPPNNQEANE